MLLSKVLRCVVIIVSLLMKIQRTRKESIDIVELKAVIMTDVIREGTLRKRTSRLQAWSTRYFILSGSKLGYKLKKDSPSHRATFDLQAGCATTEVIEESLLKGKKVYTFWIVWPHDKNSNKSSVDDDKAGNVADDSDDEDSNLQTHKGVKEIMQKEQQTQRNHQKLIENEVRNHKAQDHNYRLGVQVAAVAAGGAVVGVLTAGFGLIPYMAIVGVTAVAGGGAVFFQSYSRPNGSRLIVASESREDAEAWKTSIQEQINILDRYLKPMLPDSADPFVISSIIGMNTNRASWKCIGYREGMRLLEQLEPPEGTICRKAQLPLHICPMNVFISIMEGNYWPQHGSLKVEKAVDDHVDIVIANVHTSVKKPSLLPFIPESTTQYLRTLRMTRFWKWDDDGMYLITFNTVKPINDETKPISVPKQNDPSVDIVITISSRMEHASFEHEVPSCLVTCIVQVSTKSDWKSDEISEFINNMLCEQLLDLRQSLMNQRFGHNTDLSVMPTAVAVPPTNHNVPMLGLKRSVSLGPDVIHNQAKSHHIPPTDMSLNRQNTINPPRSISGIAIRSGVATKQPGLEDASMNAYDQMTAVNSLDYDDVGPPKSSPTQLHKSYSLFRRNKKPINPSPVAISRSTSTSPLKRAVIDESSTEETKSTRNGRFGRYTRLSRLKKSENTKLDQEMSSMRMQIAEKEFKLSRLLKNQGKNDHEALRTAKTLINDINQMKLEYQSKYGVSYDQPTKRRGFGRFRSIPKPTAVVSTFPMELIESPVPDSLKSDTTSHSTNKSSLDSDHDDMGSASVTRYPSHWNSKSSEFEAIAIKNEKIKDRLINIVIRLTFLVILAILTILLRQFIHVVTKTVSRRLLHGEL